MDNSTPMRAIRAKCLDCSNDSANEVRICPITRCPLYPYRLGRNPNIKPRELTEEQRAEVGRRLASSKGNKSEAFPASNDTGEDGSEIGSLCSAGENEPDGEIEG